MERRWEYKLISGEDIPSEGWLGLRKREAVEAYLNQLGAEGWEIVGVDFLEGMNSPSYFQALARRERE